FVGLNRGQKKTTPEPATLSPNFLITPKRSCLALRHAPSPGARLVSRTRGPPLPKLRLCHKTFLIKHSRSKRISG
ncbi:hypothetical protein AVEN_89980-1, partial [Araneus ventricosus]